MKEIFWSRVIRSVSLSRLANSASVILSLALSRLLRRAIVWGEPFIVTVEPTIRCNLACPQCLAGMKQVVRAKANMDVLAFRHFLDVMGANVWHLLLYNQGEPFLNSDILTFIGLAKQRRIYVTISTNGHFLRDKDFVRELVSGGLDSIIVSLDGADEQTYQAYRRGGNFSAVVEGIELLAKMRDELRSPTPKIVIQCLVMKHNEQQMGEMRALADRLGADRLLFKTFQVEFQENGESFLPDSPNWRRYEFVGDQIQPRNKLTACTRLWYSTVILSDGRIVPCCFDKNGAHSFGNITAIKTVDQFWKSDEYHRFRNAALRGAEQIHICRNCTQNQKVYL
ncbi:MAG: radical SAM/SPASM domain-containing protein [Candidatus Zhuqueibacterota bacterium]